MKKRPTRDNDPAVFLICTSCTRGFEGMLFTAANKGWKKYPDGRTLCPKCKEETDEKTTI